MAFKNTKHLTTRGVGKIVGQIHKLISLYADFFSPRERTYIKNMINSENHVYWLCNQRDGAVSTVAIVDPNYEMKIDGVEVVLVGHTISTMHNEIHQILPHIMHDYESKAIVVVCKNSLGQAMQLEQIYGFQKLTPFQLLAEWPSLANKKTAYFNLKNKETFADGLDRKDNSVFVKLKPEHIEILKKSAVELVA